MLWLSLECIGATLFMTDKGNGEAKSEEWCKIAQLFHVEQICPSTEEPFEEAGK